MAGRLTALRDVIGHAGTVRLLGRLVDRGRLPHALVLEGPPGCGRRTVARALAAALLCPERVLGDACGVCAHCAQAAAGTHPDIAELPGQREAPTGLPVEMARTMAEAASSTPLLGVAKAIIVPDAERLRGATANALLKILEEPPPGTTLILTAGASASLLGTIRSRTQAYRLQALTQPEQVALLERHGVDRARARAIAAAGGSVRAAAAVAAPEAPLKELRRLLSGLDMPALASVLAQLPSRVEDDGDDGEARTPAAVQRACLREWLMALGAQVRGELRSPEPRTAGVALEQLDRIARAVADLDRNHTPRLALEALTLAR